MSARRIEVVVRVSGQEPIRQVLEPGEYLIGRDPSCAICVELADVSRTHARLVIGPQEVQIEDLGSTFGTYVKGEQITGVLSLALPQEIQLAKAVIALKPCSNTERGHLAPASPGEVFKGQKYKEGNTIAAGGMGSIQEVQDLRLHRGVAMKRMLPGMEQLPEALQRFVREAQVLGQLEHPHIVPIHELGLDEQGQVFYTMKFVQGITLQAVLDQLKEGVPEMIARFPLSQLLSAFQKVCDAVAFAHSKGIIHRDLKPANIMLGDYGEVLVMDWGLAKIMSEPGSVVAEAQEKVTAVPNEGGEMGTTHTTALPTDTPANLTMQGTVLGTPNFMAPEQAAGRVDQIDPRTDIFALGGILYNILTLRVPVSGSSTTEILKQVKGGHIAPPVFFNRSGMEPDGTVLSEPIALAHCPGGKVPESLSAVAMKALAGKPADRYQTVAELQKDIQAYQSGFITSAEEAGVWKQARLLIKRRKKEFALAAAVLLVLSGLGAGSVLKINAERRQALAALRKLQATAPTHFNLARALMEEKRFTEALEKIDYALSLKPNEAGYHLFRGNICQSLFRFKDARAAYAQAVKLDPKNALAAQNIKLGEQMLAQTAEGETPSAPVLEQLRLAMLNQGRPSEAVAIAGRIGAGLQDDFARWQAALEKVGLKNSLKKEPDGGLLFDLSGSNVRDLAALKSVPLTALSLEACPNLTDLSPLKGAPLSRAKIFGTHIADLNPLRGMPLTDLLLGDGEGIITDLSPLRGLPLKILDLRCKGIVDLSSLSGMPLTTLYVIGSKVTDLTPLKGVPLVSLTLKEGPQVRDLSPLRGTLLQRLELDGHPVNDLSPLQGMPLGTLHLSSTPVKDLSPLSGMPLNDLRLHLTKVSDLTSLRGLPLRSLNLYKTLVSDLSPLQGSPMEDLFLADTPVKDIAPLKGMPLIQLILSGTKVSDLAPLRGMPTKFLACDRCSNITDLSPLTECRQLEMLTIPTSARNVDVLRQLPNLKRLSYAWTGSWDGCATAAEFWKAYDARKR